MFKKKALRINTYLGYGTQEIFRASGRALEDENIDFSMNQSIFKTLKNIYRQFESDEIRNTKIQITIPDYQTLETTTDQEGYFHIELEKSHLKKLKVTDGWLPYTVSYVDDNPKKKISNGNQFDSQMLIPSTSAQFGIISDIDDTILHTGVASILKWRLIVNTIFKNFDKRKAIDGTATFYNRLQYGTSNQPINPFFYVSNSPWNLYDYLKAFFETHHFPKGPILLRDFRTPFDRTPKPITPHKQSEILSILKLYPNLNFILIGDSGEKDPDIYTEIARNFPGRILAIYLRNVAHKKKEKRTRKIIDSFQDTPVLLINDHLDALDHARAIGLIS